MNHVKMQLDLSLLIVSIRNNNIKLNYPHGDNGLDHHHLLIPPSSHLTVCVSGVFEFLSVLCISLWLTVCMGS